MRLSNQRYEEIKREISKLLVDRGMNSLPVDVFELAKKMSIDVVFRSQMIKKGINVDEIKTLDSDSFLYRDIKNTRVIIYINDFYPIERQRFSLAHEIVHYVLNHHGSNEEIEAEADFGASYLLAPTPLAIILHNNKMLKNIIISEIFFVSKTAAEVIFQRFKKRIECSIEKFNCHERAIINLFGDSLIDKLLFIRQCFEDE